MNGTGSFDPKGVALHLEAPRLLRPDVAGDGTTGGEVDDGCVIFDAVRSEVADIAPRDNEESPLSEIFR
jgi:hypothetical protein